MHPYVGDHLGGTDAIAPGRVLTIYSSSWKKRGRIRVKSITAERTFTYVPQRWYHDLKDFCSRLLTGLRHPKKLEAPRT
jgi:hypothetical protein